MLEIERQELLEKLAYQSWIDRGQPIGSPEIDWLIAEHKLGAQIEDTVNIIDRATGAGTFTGDTSMTDTIATLPLEAGQSDASEVETGKKGRPRKSPRNSKPTRSPDKGEAAGRA